MPSRREITDAVDARLAVLLPSLVSRQDAYAASRGGRYFQGLRTHTAVPTEGEARTADRLAAKPTDQADDWAAFGVSELDEPFAMELHTHRGPQGRGWSCIAVVDVAGTAWFRIVGRGPGSRDVPWRAGVTFLDGGGSPMPSDGKEKEKEK